MVLLDENISSKRPSNLRIPWFYSSFFIVLPPLYVVIYWQLPGVLVETYFPMFSNIFHVNVWYSVSKGWFSAPKSDKTRLNLRYRLILQLFLHNFATTPTCQCHKECLSGFRPIFSPYTLRQPYIYRVQIVGNDVSTKSNRETTSGFTMYQLNTQQDSSLITPFTLLGVAR